MPLPPDLMKLKKNQAGFKWDAIQSAFTPRLNALHSIKVISAVSISKQSHVTEAKYH